MLYHIDLPIPDSILEQAKLEEGYKSYYDTKNKHHINGWDQKHIDSGPAYEYSKIIQDILELKDVRPRFYIQHTGMTIPMHKDRGTQCSFNFILEGTSPITFEYGEEYYQKAILNTQSMHAVYNTIDDRVLYKISIFDQSYDEVVKRYNRLKEELKNTLNNI